MSNNRADNTLRTAQNLGQLGTSSVRGLLDKQDRLDFYKFTLASRSSFSLSLNGLKANADVKVLNALGGALVQSNRFGKRPEIVSTTLEAGSYYISVRRRGGNTSYRLFAAATALAGAPLPGGNPTPQPQPQPQPTPLTPLFDPGTTPATAYDVGFFAGNLSYREFVGTVDETDYYKFTLGQTSSFSANLSGKTDAAGLTLLFDKNNNGLYDSSESIDYDFGYGSSNSSISTTLGAGTYFVRVQASSSNTSYDLNLSATATPGTAFVDPGQTLGTAYDVGTLLGAVTVKEFVGMVDETDYYKFTLGQTSSFSANLSGKTDAAGLTLLFDKNNNGLYDSSESIDYDFGYGSSNSSISTTLGAGTYFVRVQASSSNTNYSLALSI